MDNKKTLSFDAFNKDSLIQPNEVTQASYAYTAIQENVLTCIIGAIQDHMTKVAPIQTDLFGQPIVRIDTRQVGGNKTRILKDLTNLRKKDIYYRYEDSEGSKKVETGLISGYTDVEQTPYVDVHVSSYSIPYLVYWGGKGFTKFSRMKALTLKGKYTKRIYKMLKQWESVGHIPNLSPDDLIYKFQMPASYAKKAFMIKYCLEPAKTELDAHGDITFTYSFEKKNSRSYNVINIKIFSTEYVKEDQNPLDWNSFVFRHLCHVYPVVDSNKSKEITDQIQGQGQMKDAYDRFKRLQDEYNKGEKGFDEMIKLTVHILREDFGIKTKKEEQE